jgi:hypothetical protein
MALTNKDLFDFDHARLADFDLARERQKLADQGPAYRAQLVTAKWIDGWRERMAKQKESPTAHDEDWYEGFDFAAREMAAHLRQGDLLPGGILHDETDEGKL